MTKEIPSVRSVLAWSLRARTVASFVAMATLTIAGCASTHYKSTGRSASASSKPAMQANASTTALPAAKLAPVAYKEDAFHVEGLLADACQCEVFCPCEFKGLPSHGCCDDSAILHVDKGTFGGVNLDHTDVVIVSESPAGQRMVDNVGNLSFARIYVTKSVNDAQAAALADAARAILGTFVKDRSRLSADETVHKVDLTVSASESKASARIPGVLSLNLETNTGGDEKTPIRIQNSPWSAPGIGDAMVAHSTTYDYTCEGRDWHYAGRSASFRTFKLDGSVKPPPPAPTPN